MSGCINLTGDSLKAIAKNIPQISVLNISKWEINGVDLELLCPLQNLKELILSDCRKVKDSGVINFLLQTESKLLKLDIKGVSNPTTALLKALRSQNDLRYLNLSIVNPFFNGSTFTD